MQDVKNKYRYLPKKENPQMTPELSRLFVLCVQFKMLASLPVEMTSSRCMGRATPLPKPAFFTGTATFKVQGLLALIMHPFLTSVDIS